MRRFMIVAAAVAGFAGAGLLATTSAQALPGTPAAVGHAVANAEQVALVCPRPFWNGWRWVRPACYHTGPIYAPPAYVVPPPPVVVRPWRRHYRYY